MILLVLVLISILSIIINSYNIKPFRRQYIHKFTSAYISNSKRNCLDVLKIDRKQLLNPLNFKLSENDQSDTVLVDIDDDDDDGNGGLMNPELMMKLSKGIIPLAASIGFTVTPSTRIATRIVGAAAGGILGYFAKNSIDANLKAISDSNNSNNGGGNGSGSSGSSSAGLSLFVKNALKQAITGNVPIISMNLKTLENIAKNSKVPEDELSAFFASIFAEVIYEAIQADSMDLTELGEILDFANTLNLSRAEIGDGFALAATRLGKLFKRDNRGFYVTEVVVANDDGDILYQASKIFFLADKLLGSSEGYYGKRLQNSLMFYTIEEFQEIITEACKQLFRRCIESVLVTPDSFTKNEVEELKDFLTTSTKASSLRPAAMQNMVMEAIQFTLDKALNDKSSTEMTAKLENYEKFLRAQSILGWNERELNAVIEIRTMPLFEKATKTIFAMVEDKPDRAEELTEVLKQRLVDLNIDVNKAQVYITTLISDFNLEYMRRIDKVYEASEGVIEPAFKIMMGYTHIHDAFRKLTQEIMNDIEIPIPGLPFADMIRVSMYEMQQNKGGDKSGVRSDMFDLTDEQRKSVRKHLALPKVTSWIMQCINEANYAPEAKAAYEKLLNDYGVTSDEWIATSIDFYYQEVARIARARAVPSLDDVQRLKSLQSFLGLSDTTTTSTIEKQVILEKVNLQLLGDKYVKAVTEAMTPTGVISEEYIDGLERLRDRLGLSKSDAEKLLNVAARTRMGPIIKDLTDIWKSDTDANYRREREKDKASKGQKPKDKRGDPISSLDNELGFTEMSGQKEGGGPNVFMREALNLVDFFIENYVATQSDSSTQTLITIDDHSPVTASGIVPESDLAGMLKHYLITRLAEQDPELRQRYIEAEPWFAKILGINLESQLKIKQSLAYSAYKGMLMNVLMYKGVVDSKDIAQFVALKDSLQLDKEIADKVYLEATKGAIIEHAAKLFRDSENGESFTPQIAKTFREQVQSVGLDIQKDTGFNEKLITYLYALEVQYLIENELVNELNDVQQAYEIPEERATEIIEASCRRYVDQLINLGLRSSRKYDDRNTIQWIKKIIKYAIFISTPVEADGNLFNEEDKKQLISVYQTEVEAQQDTELMNMIAEYGDMTEKLRELINLTETYVAPVQGMEGLLGNGRSYKQMEDDKYKETDNGKKAWAWG